MAPLPVNSDCHTLPDPGPPREREEGHPPDANRSLGILRVIVGLSTVQVLAMVITLLRSKIVAILLGPRGIGITSVIDQFVQFVAYICTLSMPLTATKFLSKSHSLGPIHFRRTYSAFLKLLLLLSGVGMFATLGLVFFRPELLPAEFRDFRGPVALALLGVPIAGLSTYFTNVFAAAREVRKASLLTFITNACLAAGAVAGIVVGGISGMYIGSFTMGVAVIVAVALYLRAQFHIRFYDPSTTVLRELSTCTRFTALLLGQYVTTISYSVCLLLVRFLVLRHHGPAVAGLLQSQVALAGSLALVLQSPTFLFLTPIINRNTSPGEKMHAVNEYQHRFVAVIFMAALPLLAFPRSITALLFSRLFAEVGQHLFLFVVSTCVFLIAGVYQYLLIGIDDIKGYAVITCLGHGLACALAWLLIQRQGIPGAAIALLAGNLLTLALCLARLALHWGVIGRSNWTGVIGWAIPLLLALGWVLSLRVEGGAGVIALRVLVVLACMLLAMVFVPPKDRITLRVAAMKFLRK